MDLQEAIETLKPFIGDTDTSEYDGLIVKKLTASNTLDENRTTHQRHIAITGEQMDIFPYLTAGAYFDNDYNNRSEDLKKYFVLRVPVVLHRRNVISLGADPIEIIGNSDEKTVKMCVFRSRREGAADQIQLSLIAYDDQDFVEFRKILHEDDWLVLIKFKGEVRYDCYGIHTDDETSLIPLNNKFLRLKNACTPVEATDFSVLGEPPREYTSTAFLDDVFITEEQYNQLCELLRRKMNIILEGPPGTGKTFAAKRLAYSIMGETDDSRVRVIQFHQNYYYEDFIMGYKPSGRDFILQTGVFYDFCVKAAADQKRPYFFIIDEINRGNISKIFGELLQMIEKEYRGKYITLPMMKDTQFTVPKNLYIIGMMNTADRSIAMIDYALRRRFAFFDMKPGFDTEGFHNKYPELFEDPKAAALINAVKKINSEICESLGEGFEIGHSYFCGKKGIDYLDLHEWLESTIDYDLIPLLKEYWYDNHSMLDEQIKTLKNALL